VGKHQGSTKALGLIAKGMHLLDAGCELDTKSQADASILKIGGS